MKQYLTKKLQALEKILFFLTILFLPTQLGKHFWPEFSFIYSLRIDYLSPTIYFWDLLVLFLLLVASVRMFLKQSNIKLNQKFLFFFLFFILTQAMSIIPAVNKGGAVLRLLEYLISGSLALYLSSCRFFDIKNLFFAGFILSVLFTCLLATTQFLLGHSIGFWILGERNFNLTTPLIARFSFYEEVFLRPYATFPHPNMLAAFLVLSLPLSLLGVPKKFKNFKLMLGLFIASNVFITFSRPALILIQIQTFLLFRRFWKIWLILAVIITPLIFVRLVSVFTFDSLAVLRRQELSTYAIQTYLNNPLSGIGLNNFINVLAADHILVGTSRFLQPAHNIFLLILSETGALGLFGFLGLFLTAFWQNFKQKDSLSKVLLGNLLVIIFLGFFDHYFLTLPQGQRLLFLLLGLSFMRK